MRDSKYYVLQPADEQKVWSSERSLLVHSEGNLTPNHETHMSHREPCDRKGALNFQKLLTREPK